MGQRILSIMDKMAEKEVGKTKEIERNASFSYPPPSRGGDGEEQASAIAQEGWNPTHGITLVSTLSITSTILDITWGMRIGRRERSMGERVGHQL